MIDGWIKFVWENAYEKVFRWIMHLKSFSNELEFYDIKYNCNNVLFTRFANAFLNCIFGQSDQPSEKILCLKKNKR